MSAFIKELTDKDAAVRAVICQLENENQRKVLLLKLDGLTGEEIASELYYSVRTVNYHHKNALESVKRILDAQEPPQAHEQARG